MFRATRPRFSSCPRSFWGKVGGEFNSIPAAETYGLSPCGLLSDDLPSPLITHMSSILRSVFCVSNRAIEVPEFDSLLSEESDSDKDDVAFDLF